MDPLAGLGSAATLMAYASRSSSEVLEVMSEDEQYRVC
jgi:hypothetical protein